MKEARKMHTVDSIKNRTLNSMLFDVSYVDNKNDKTTFK